MAKYSFDGFMRDGDIVWCVIEARTGYTIESFYFEPDAQQYSDFLNKGAAFDGYTPKFMLTKVVVPDAINSKFSQTFS